MNKNILLQRLFRWSFLFLIFPIALSLFFWCKKKPKVCVEDRDNLLYQVYDQLSFTYFFNQNLPPIEVFQPACKNSLSELLEEIKIYSDGLDQETSVYYPNEKISVSTGLHPFLSLGKFVVAYVEIGSPAYQKGVKRGMRLKQLDDKEIYEYDYNFLRDLHTQILPHKYLFEYENKAGNTQEFETTFGASTFKNSSIVLKEEILTFPVQKTGYLVLLDLFLTSDKNRIYDFFKKLQIQNIQHLIIDLRYALQGGEQKLAEFIANSLIERTYNTSTSLLYRYQFNKKYMDYYEKNQFLVYVNKNSPNFFDFTHTASDLDLENLNLIFIVTENTGKLSSFLIDILQPFFGDRLKIVGQKPNLPSSYVLKLNKYRSGEQIVYVSHELRNKNDEIYYLKEAQITFAEDAVEKIYDFADPQENMLNIALGVFFGTSKARQSQEKKWKIQHKKVSEKNIIEE